MSGRDITELTDDELDKFRSWCLGHKDRLDGSRYEADMVRADSLNIVAELLRTEQAVRRIRERHGQGWTLSAQAEREGVPIQTILNIVDTGHGLEADQLSATG